MLESTKADYESLASFRRALRTLIRFTERTARKAGVTPQQHQVLLATMGQPGRDWASVGEIRNALKISPDAVVGLIDRCQTAGLVTREPNPRDRRVVRVGLTEEGRRVLAQITETNLRELRGWETLSRELARLLGSADR